MLNGFKFLAAAALTLLPLPVLAQSCGTLPVRPAIAAPSVIKGQKSEAEAADARHQAFVQVKTWQDAVKPYRDCLNGIIAGDKKKMAQADAKKDADAIKQWKAEAAAADKAFNSSVDTEELIVNDFHAVQAAYCMRKDADASSCPD